MWSWFKRLTHRPAIRMGRMDSPRGRTTAVRNTRFVSFLNSEGSFTSVSSDRHDSRIRRRKAVRSLLWSGGLGAMAWVALESARALTLF